MATVRRAIFPPREDAPPAARTVTRNGTTYTQNTANIGKRTAERPGTHEHQAVPDSTPEPGGKSAPGGRASETLPLDDPLPIIPREEIEARQEKAAEDSETKFNRTNANVEWAPRAVERGQRCLDITTSHARPLVPTNVCRPETGRSSFRGGRGSSQDGEQPPPAREEPKRVTVDPADSVPRAGRVLGMWVPPSASGRRAPRLIPASPAEIEMEGSGDSAAYALRKDAPEVHVGMVEAGKKWIPINCSV